jgi:hypothetical protein
MDSLTYEERLVARACLLVFIKELRLALRAGVLTADAEFGARREMATAESALHKLTESGGHQ